jgi:hypothetical protein
MVTDPADLSDDELEGYLRELFDQTEELNATAIRIRIRGDMILLTGDVPTVEQRNLAEMLVLDVVPEDRIVNDLMVIPEVDTEASPEETPPEAPVEVSGENLEVEHEDPDEAAQEGKPYEPPIAPTPEPKHEGEW